MNKIIRNQQFWVLLAAMACCGVLGCTDDVAVGVDCGDIKCNAGEACVELKCVPESSVCGDVVCTAQQECKDNKCVDIEIPPADLCANKTCNDGEKCVNGDCVPDEVSDPCAKVTCENGNVCQNGQCIPEDLCSSVNCNEGQSCLAGKCYDDACIVGGAVMACPEGEICSKGNCVSDGCENVKCEANETCVRGLCEETACIGVICGAGTSCLAGACVENACLSVECPAGEVCKNAECIPEVCKDVECSQDKVCQSDGSCKFDSDPALVVSFVNDDNETSEDGKSAVIQVALNHQPASDVTVACESSNTKEGEVECNVVFNAENWNVPQQVTVTGVKDSAIDGNQDYSVHFSTTSEDAEFNGLQAESKLVNVDTSSNGIVVNLPENLMTSEDQSADPVVIEVSLSAAPEGEVKFSVYSDKVEEGRFVDASGAFLSENLLEFTFTPENWNQPQLITVKGVDDNDMDGSQDYSIVFNKTVSEDSNWNDLDTASIILTNKDNDSVGATIPGKKLTVDEKDRKASVDIVLNTKPKDNVTVSVVISDPAEAASDVSEVVFTPDNWNQTQKVTFSGVPDNIIDDDKPFTVTFQFDASADEQYAKLDPVVVNGVNLNIDEAALTVLTDGTTSISENGEEFSFQVALTSIPTDDVKLNVLSGETSAFTIISDAALHFTPENWNVPQTITVKGVDDLIVDGEQKASVMIDAESKDVHYKRLATSALTLTVLDDDAAGFVIEGEGKALAEELGEKATYSVRLTAQPRANVTVALASSDATELVLDGKTSLTFTSSNWNVAQVVTVKSKDDNDADGNQTAYIKMTASSGDAAFNKLQASSPVYTIVDDESASIVIAPISFVLEPDQKTASFTVKLGSAPSANVEISFASSAPSVINYTNKLTFTPNDWNKEQTVKVTVADYQKAVATETLTASAKSSVSAYNSNKLDTPVTFKIYAFKKKDFAFTGAVQKETLLPGKYKLQVWGASGGDGQNFRQDVGSHGGLGGYSYGTLTLDAKSDVFVQVGGAGSRGYYESNGKTGGGYNGGGNAAGYDGNPAYNFGYGGGGASDIRIGQDSLYARVIVAGGGGGADNPGGANGTGDDGSGGYGGGTSGGAGIDQGKNNNNPTGATQTAGFAFGQGAVVSGGDAGAGGGGWFGGRRGINGNCGGSGGSGFVYTGNSNVSSATIGGTWLLNSKHYLSGGSTVAGNTSFESIGGGAETGHAGNGYARITLVE